MKSTATFLYTAIQRFGVSKIFKSNSNLNMIWSKMQYKNKSLKYYTLWCKAEFFASFSLLCHMILQKKF